MLALLRFALNSSIFVDHNEFLDELTFSAACDHPTHLYTHWVLASLPTIPWGGKSGRQARQGSLPQLPQTVRLVHV